MKKCKKLLALFMAILMVSSMFSSLGITSFATDETQLQLDSYYTVNIAGDPVWLEFTPEESGTYMFESFGEDNDPKVYLYEDPHSSYIDYDDDSGDNLNFSLTCYLTAGVTYYFECTLYSMGYTSYDVKLTFVEDSDYPDYNYGPTFSMTVTPGAVGDEIVVTISGNDVSGLESADLEINYDATHLEFVSVGHPDSYNYYMGTGANIDEGVITWSFLYFDSAYGTENFVEIHFNVLKEGSSEISVTADSWEGSSTPDDYYFTFTPTVDSLLGDLDGDGYTTSADARITLRIAARLDTNSNYFTSADIDQGGTITAADARLCLRYSIFADIPEAEIAPVRTSLDVERSSDVKLNISSDPYIVGREFTVRISASKVAGLESANLFLTYDSAALEFVSLSFSSDSDFSATAYSEYEKGKIGLGFLFLENATSSSFDIAELTFRANDTVTDPIECHVGTFDGTEVPEDVTYFLTETKIGTISEGETKTITISPEKYVTVITSAEYFAGTESADLEFYYDADFLKYVSLNKLGDEIDMAAGGNPEPGLCTFSFLFYENATMDSDLVAITFKLLQSGSTTINMNITSWEGTEAPENASLTIYSDDASTYRRPNLAMRYEYEYSSSAEDPDPLLFIPEESGEYRFYSTSTDRDPYGYIEDASGYTIASSDDESITDNYYDFCVTAYLDAGEYYYLGSRLYYGIGTYDVTIEKNPDTKLILTVNNELIYEGETFDVILSGDKISGLTSTDLTITYDYDHFEFVNIRTPENSSAALTAGDKIEDGTIKWSMVFEDCAYENEDLAIITFKALESYYVSDVSVSVDSWEGTETPLPANISIFTEGADIFEDSEITIEHAGPSEVKVIVDCSNFAGTESADLEFYYDADFLEFVNLRSLCTDAISAGGNPERGFCTFSFCFLQSATRDSDLVEITFKLLQTGSTTIDMNFSSWAGTDRPEPASLTISNPPSSSTFARPVIGMRAEYIGSSNVESQFVFIPETTGEYVFSSSSVDCDPVGFIYDRNMNLIAENDNANGENPYDFSVVAELTAGHIYYLESTTNGTPNTYTISIKKTTVEVPVCEHTNTIFANYVEATCAAPGYTGDIFCADCGELVSFGTEIPELECTFGEWTVTTEATCTQEGLKVRVCSLCGREESETIATKEHNLEHVTVPSTCTVAGVEYDICTECDESFNSKTLELSEHTIVVVPGKDATCTETGLTAGEKCAECNTITVEQLTIPAKDHSFGDWAVLTEATCTQEGLKLRACTICSASESETIAVKEAHNLEHVIVPSTCTVAGVEYDICTECDASFNNKTLELADHTTEVIPGKDATCTETGLADGAKCTVCNAVTVEQVEIPAKGHSFGEWTVTKEATYMFEGEQTKACYCGETITEATPKLVAEKEAIDENSNISVKFQDESYAGDMEVTATELFDGSSYQILNNEKGNFNSTLFDITTTINGEKVQPDGMVLVGIPLPEGYNAEETVVYYVSNDGSGLEKMNSYYEDGIIWFETNHFSAYALVDESAEKPTVVKGDVNGDGQITAADARLVLRASAKLEVLTENEKLAADVVKDNNITAADARLILRVSAKLDSFA